MDAGLEVKSFDALSKDLKQTMFSTYNISDLVDAAADLKAKGIENWENIGWGKSRFIIVSM